MADKEFDLQVPITDLSGIQPIGDEPEGKYVIPLDGQWMPGVDAALIGKNFTTLTNLRYVDGHPEGVLGMTKINTSIMNATYYRPRVAFHFRKAQPEESHVLAQAYNSALAASRVLQNETAIPNPGNFDATALWTDSSGASVGQFSDAPNGQVVYCNGVDTCIWGGDEIRCARFINYDSLETFLYDFTDKVTNSKTTEYATMTADTSDGTTVNFYVGSLRPLKGIKFYVGTANPALATATISYWDGSAWQAVAGFSDGTAAGGKTLWQTGTMSFTSTVDLAKPTFIEGTYLYFYKLALATINTTATIYHVTLDAAMQSVKDIWDGDYRELAAFYKYTTSRLDNTLNVREDVYDSADSETYCDLSSLTATTQYCEVGFTEKVTAMLISVAPEYENSTAATTISVDYWDGNQYTTVGTVTDKTAESGISLAKSGVVSWNNASVDDEQKQSINGGFSLYYYRIKWNQALDATVRVYYIGGVTVVTEKTGYSFAIHAADRIMLGCNNYADKNELLISAQNRPDVYNGADSYSVLFGDEKELTCGTSIYAQYAANIYNMVLAFKETETWIMTWVQTSTETTWERFRISPNIGCASPRTLATISAEFGKNINQTKVMGIWRAHNGIYISNGQSPLCVSEQIKDVFDLTKTQHASLSTLNQEVGFVDQDKMEYHWLFSTDLYEIPFVEGSVLPADGSTITGATSGATAVVDHVTSTGTWSPHSPSASLSESPSASPSMSPSASPSASPSNSPSLSPSASASPSESPSLSPSASESPSESPSPSPSESPSESPSPSPSASESPSESPSLSPSASESPSESPSLSPSASQSPSASMSPSASPSLSPSASASPSNSPSMSPSRSPSESASASFSASPSESPSASPSEEFAIGIIYVRSITGTWVSGETIKQGTDTVGVTTGAATQSAATNNTLDQEYVLDLKKWRWYEIDRGTGKRLECGVTVLDTIGNQFTYGLLDTGYMERLENGTDFDGNAIVCTLHTGDQLPIAQDMLSKTRILRANLVAVAKNTDSTVTLTHYKDGANAGTDYTLSMADASHRYANDIVDVFSTPAVFHSFKLVVSTDAETKGFEPLAFAVYYQKERDYTV